MYYAIRHLTKYRYSATITESVMEVRGKPRSEGNQHVTSFDLVISPKAKPLAYVDYMGNTIHTFDIPGAHRKLTIMSKALLEVDPVPEPPDAISQDTWAGIDAANNSGDFWDWLTPSEMTTPTEMLHTLATEMNLPDRQTVDPLTVVRNLNAAVYTAFQYTPNSTKVDSPIDDALSSRQGVCQDFTHIMLALLREQGIPARYVSGYLARRRATDRSAEDASHAWVEAYLPGLGWVGFDPTNNILASDGHIRVAIGRDYKDVPPTRGTFKGKAESHLDVAVQVLKTELPADESTFGSVTFPTPQWSNFPDDPVDEAEAYTRFQQQQQQQ
jgi:transglutaminase-like putative cysteine protease